MRLLAPANGESGWHHENGEKSLVPCRTRDFLRLGQKTMHNGKVGKKRLLTGLRPTGKFHLGNYVGTLEKDLELQNSGEYDCFIFIADYHALTTGYERSREIGSDIREGLLDFL